MTWAIEFTLQNHAFVCHGHNSVEKLSTLVIGAVGQEGKKGKKRDRNNLTHGRCSAKGFRLCRSRVPRIAKDTMFEKAVASSSDTRKPLEFKLQQQGCVALDRCAS